MISFLCMPLKIWYTSGKQVSLKLLMQDKSIPLVEVVESFDIFDVANRGASGKAVRPTHTALSNTFGTADVNLIISKILETGKVLQITAKGRNDFSKDLI